MSCVTRLHVKFSVTLLFHMYHTSPAIPHQRSHPLFHSFYRLCNYSLVCKYQLILFDYCVPYLGVDFLGGLIYCIFLQLDRNYTINLKFNGNYFLLCWFREIVRNWIIIAARTQNSCTLLFIVAVTTFSLYLI